MDGVDNPHNNESHENHCDETMSFMREEGRRKIAETLPDLALLGEGQTTPHGGGAPHKRLFLDLTAVDALDTDAIDTRIVAQNDKRRAPTESETARSDTTAVVRKWNKQFLGSSTARSPLNSDDSEGNWRVSQSSSESLGSAGFASQSGSLTTALEIISTSLQGISPVSLPRMHRPCVPHKVHTDTPCVQQAKARLPTRVSKALNGFRVC
jgi:hypothetical protein